MTNITFFTKGDDIVAFELKGHTMYGEPGTDIICASISSAAYMTINTITDILNINCGYEVKDGSMYVTLESKDVFEAQTILKGFRLHILELEKDYGDYIKVKNSEV